MITEIGSYGLAVLLSLALCVISYIGFSMFVYCSLMVLLNTIIYGMSDLTWMKNTKTCIVQFCQIVMWTVYAIPISTLLLSVNWNLIIGFFKNIAVVFDITKIKEYVEHQFTRENSYRKVITILFMFFLSGIAVCVGIMFFVAESGSFGKISFVVGIMSLLVPIFAFIKVPFYSWKSMIEAFKRKDQSIHEQTLVCTSTEDITYCSMLEEKTEVRHISLLDLFGVAGNCEWACLIQSNTGACGELRKGESKWKIAPGLFCVLLLVGFVGIDIFLSKKRILDSITISDHYTSSEIEQMLNLNTTIPQEQLDQVILSLTDMINSLNRDTRVLICGLITRCIFAIYTAPFVFDMNIVNILISWKREFKVTVINICYIASTVLAIVSFVVWSVWAGLKTHSFEGFQPGYQYLEPLKQTITKTARSGICETNWSGWTLIELAAANIATQLGRIDESDLFNFRYEFFVNDNETTWADVDKNLSLAMQDPHNISPLITAKVVNNGTDFTILCSYGGITTIYDITYVIENVLKHWYDVAMESIMPFFSIVKNIFMSTFLDDVLRDVDYWFLGFESQTNDMVTAMITFTAYQKALFDIIVNYPADIMFVSGHMSGGLTAKAVAASVNLPVVAFESPEIENSKIYSLVYHATEGIGWNKLLNVYSEGSYAAMEEKSATSNIKLPSSQSFFKPANVYTTFCQLAAACTYDDRYDHFCSYSVGPKTFESYFGMWGRDRTAPIDEYYLEDIPDDKKDL